MLLALPKEPQASLVSYSDILFRQATVKKLLAAEADVVIAVDSHWRSRYVGRSEEDLKRCEKVCLAENQPTLLGTNIATEQASAEFVGLVSFSQAAMQELVRLKAEQGETCKQLRQANLSHLIELLRIRGFSIQAVDVQGDWAELNQEADLARFILGTKAKTLSRLKSMVRQSVVLNQVSFDVADWEQGAQAILSRVQATFGNKLLAVRSSAKSEDAFTHSNAGAYTSFLKVDPNKNLAEAIDNVIASYADCQPDDQVLVQPMVEQVHLSGVAFTRTLEQGAPFYIVNYDASGDTESITSGYSKEHKSLYLRKDADDSCVVDELRPLIRAIKEVEQLLSYDALDIEFATDTSGKVYLLQVRPIAAADSLDTQTPSKHILELQAQACKTWQSLQTPAPYLFGDKALFGVMPDWNPAEIIGTNPGKLASSLYEHLILNEVWATQRAEYGYKDVRPQPLLRHFAGKPYIDIRASFNSFIPQEISDELSSKLVNFYLAWLEKHPHLHDKVEFDVVPTCFGPGFVKWEDRLSQQAQLSTPEINQLKQGLMRITQLALGRTATDLAQLDELEARHQQVLSNACLSNPEKIRLLLDNCKSYGTLPFAHLARAGFVAVTLLREGIEAGWLSQEARDGFMETVQTVSHELSAAAWATAQNTKSWESFVADYGHLRPGTYDITSPAYWDDPERYLKPLIQHAQPPKVPSKKVVAWQAEKASFFEKLRSLQLAAADEEFETFLIQAIEGREKAKFVFTKSLSAALSLLAKEGQRYGLAVEKLANLPLASLMAAFNSNLPLKNLTEQLKAEVKHNQYERKISHACQLPPLLSQPADFSAFILSEDKPNYIGSQRITASVVHLDASNQEDVQVEGCIVLIPQADPGYDWLFGQKIAGLITMYGGANSHMAIRSAEFGLPAAIGVGEQLYRSLNLAKTLELDPAGETIRLVH